MLELCPAGGGLDRVGTGRGLLARLRGLCVALLAVERAGAQMSWRRCSVFGCEAYAVSPCPCAYQCGGWECAAHAAMADVLEQMNQAR